MDLLNNPAVLALIVTLLGVFTPLLTAVVQQPAWTKNVRQAVGVAVSVVVGFLTVVGSGALSGPIDTVAVVTAVVIAAKVAYDKLWQPTGVAPTIEYATALGY